MEDWEYSEFFKSPTWLHKKDDGFSELRKHIIDLLDGCKEVTILSTTAELFQESEDNYYQVYLNNDSTDSYETISTWSENKQGIYSEFSIKRPSEIDQGQDKNTVVLMRREDGQSIAIIVVCKGMYYIDGKIFADLDSLDTHILKWVLS